jgi:hypothetical protein
VLLHGSFMTISNNWTEWIGEFSKTRTSPARGKGFRECPESPRSIRRRNEEETYETQPSERNWRETTQATQFAQE